MILPVWLWMMLAAAAPCETAGGCTCVSFGGAEEHYERAEAVFRGAVVEVEHAGHLPTTFRVVERWKGAEGETIVVDDRLLCPMWFRVGEEFLVYAIRAEDGRLETSFCVRTRRFEKAAEDVPVLDRLARDGQR